MVLHRWRWFVRHVLHRTRAADELDAEISTHLALETERRIDAGDSPEEAQRAARKEFGNILLVKDVTRDMWGWGFVERTWHDVRYGARMLRKRPGFTVVAVLSLAIGIGANTAIFSVVNAVLLRQVPYDRPEELVNIYTHLPSFPFAAVSYPNFEDLRDGTTEVFSGMASAALVPVQIDQAEGVGFVLAEAVTGDFFRLLGIEPLLGRAIGPEDDLAPGAHPVVMLSHGYWRSRFAADPDVVGRELRVGGRAYSIIGVVPATYRGSVRAVEPLLYAPMTMLNELLDTDNTENRDNHGQFAKARLAPGVTLAQAETAVAAVAASLTTTRPDGWVPGYAFAVVPTTDVLMLPPVDQLIRATAWLLMVVVGLVLLVACTNLASFLLARERDRRRDVAVRLALGASRGALVRQSLTETTLLGLLGGGAGVGLAVWLLGALAEADLPLLPLPVTLDFGLDWTVLAFTFGISVLAGTVLGLLPALQSTRLEVAQTLKAESTGGGAPGQLRWRNVLVVTQLTVSLVLIVGAGLFLRSWQQMLAVDPGFGRSPTALLSVRIPGIAGNARQQAGNTRQQTDRLLDRFRALPGVDAVGRIDGLPLDPVHINVIRFTVDGHAPPQDFEWFQADVRRVDGGFFEAAGIPIVRGRSFMDAEPPDGQRVAIISEAMARRFWPDGDAVGRIVHQTTGDQADLRVVGVASDISVRALGESPRLMVYLSYEQVPIRGVTFVARTSADPEQTALALMTAGRDVDPDLRVVEAKTMTRHLSTALLPGQLIAFLVSVFGVLSLLLAAIGLYGVVSYAVATRAREVGIRMALGADAPAVVRLLTASGARLILVGSGIGLVLSLLVTRLLSGLLFGIETFDPITFVGAGLVLGATSLLAAYLPARRASHVDLVAALRAD